MIVRRVASFDVAFETGRDWNATIVSVTHRRTGAVSKFSVLVSGTGADVQMTVASVVAPFVESTVLTVPDLPEHEARLLLTTFATEE